MAAMMDTSGLAQFLRLRRAALQPEDVGLPRGARRRTDGLRREEVSALCHMSTDYYTRLERQRGPRPSVQMVRAIAQGLRLTLDERDHLLRLAGHQPPPRTASSDHISPGLGRVLDRLGDTPAAIVTELGETLRQTPLAVALNGDTTGYEGPARSIGYRWFTDPDARRRYLPEDRVVLSRRFVSGLRQLVALRGPDSRAAGLADLLLDHSEEFVVLWAEQEVGVGPPDVKRLVHPDVGLLELQCQTLRDPVQSHSLLVYTAIPGTDSHGRLMRLARQTGAVALSR